jgi:hypothetical protein
MFGEWYQKTNKTEDTNKLTLLALKIIAILHNTRLATFIRLLETVSKGLFRNRSQNRCDTFLDCRRRAANKVNLFVSSVLFVFWSHSPNFLDTPHICDISRLRVHIFCCPHSNHYRYAFPPMTYLVEVSSTSYRTTFSSPFFLFFLLPLFSMVCARALNRSVFAEVSRFYLAPVND